MEFFLDGSGQRARRAEFEQVEPREDVQHRPAPGKSSRTHGGGDVLGIPGKISLTARLAQHLGRPGHHGNPAQHQHMVARMLGAMDEPRPAVPRSPARQHGGSLAVPTNAEPDQASLPAPVAEHMTDEFGGLFERPDASDRALAEHGRVGLPPASGTSSPAGVVDSEPERAAKTKRLIGELAAGLRLDENRVVVHTDEEGHARTSARQAKGVMIDGEVFLNPDAYDPDTREGRALLAHEIIHLAQRRARRTEGVQQYIGAEAEARSLAETFASGRGISAARIPLQTGKAAADNDDDEAQSLPTIYVLAVRGVPPDLQGRELTIFVVQKLGKRTREEAEEFISSHPMPALERIVNERDGFATLSLSPAEYALLTGKPVDEQTEARNQDTDQIPEDQADELSEPEDDAEDSGAVEASRHQGSGDSDEQSSDAAGAREPSTALVVTDVATDFVPIVSNIKDAWIAITGINPVTGEEASTFERILSALFAIPGLGNVAKYLGKGGKFLFKGLKWAARKLVPLGKKMMSAARWAGKKIGSGAKWAGKKLWDGITKLRQKLSETLRGRKTKAAVKSSSPRAIIEPGKFDYLFGKAKGTKNAAHNAPRTNQNAMQMKRLGVHDDPQGRQLLQEHFERVVSEPGNIVETWANEYGKYEKRESLFAGPSGKFAKFESTWEIMEDGSRRLTTVIPMGGPKKGAQ